MPESQSYTVKLSQEEALLISMNLRLPLMVGVDRNMLYLPQGDLQEILKSAEATLIERDYLRVDQDGSKRLAPIVTACVVTCAKPERTFILSRAQNAMPTQTMMVHQSMEMIVNHLMSGPGEHVFVVLPTLKPAIDAMLQLSQARAYANPDCPAASLSESVFVEANQLAQEHNPGALYTLLTRQLPEKTALGFYQTLDTFDASVTAARLVHGENPGDTQKDGFTLLQGGSIQWLLRSSGAAPNRVVSLEGAAAKDVRRELKKLLQGQ